MELSVGNREREAVLLRTKAIKILHPQSKVLHPYGHCQLACTKDNLESKERLAWQQGWLSQALGQQTYRSAEQTLLAKRFIDLAAKY